MSDLRIQIGLVYTDRWSDTAEQVLVVKLIGAEGELIDSDYITARQMRDWLGLEHPQ